jgi:hypothetical protein
MQLADIITAISNLLDEDGVRRPESTLTATVNDGYRIVSVITQACEHSTSYRASAGSLISTLPVDLYTPVSVYYEGSRLYPTRLPDLYELEPTWLTTASGTPLYYTTIGTLTESPQLWLYPPPSAAGTVRMTYASVPGPLAYNSDVPEFPREHHYTLVWWAYAWELLKERSALLANKSFQIYNKFLEDATALQQYVYRRTPDRDWMSPPLDAEAVRRKMVSIEQALVRQPGTIEQQVMQQ